MLLAVIAIPSIVIGNLLAVVFNDSSNEIPFDISFEIVEDIAVKSKDEKKIKGHKVFLAAFSPAFKSMFFGPMKEEKEIVQIAHSAMGALAYVTDSRGKVHIPPEK